MLKENCQYKFNTKSTLQRYSISQFHKLSTPQVSYFIRSNPLPKQLHFFIKYLVVVHINMLFHSSHLFSFIHLWMFQLVGSRGKDTQSTMHSYHANSGIIYYAQINKNAISCWNSNRELNPSNFKEIVRDDIKLVYPSDLMVSLWYLTVWTVVWKIFLGICNSFQVYVIMALI